MKINSEDHSLTKAVPGLPLPGDDKKFLLHLSDQRSQGVEREGPPPADIPLFLTAQELPRAEK